MLFALSAVMVVGLAAGVPQSARIAASEALDIQTARSAAAPYFRVALKTEGRGRTRSGPSHVFTTLSGYRALTRTGSIGGGWSYQSLVYPCDLSPWILLSVAARGHNSASSLTFCLMSSCALRWELRSLLTHEGTGIPSFAADVASWVEQGIRMTPSSVRNPLPWNENAR